MVVVKNKKDDLDKGKVRVFVYGTLKSEHGNNRLLKLSNAKFMGYESITGAYRMYDMGSFPAIMDRTDKEHTTICGELWSLDTEGLASIDLLEGHPHFYARRKLWTDLQGKRAWVYFLTSHWKDDVEDDDEVDQQMWEPSAEETEFWEAKL